jgi:hypothetical protein
MSDHDDDPIAKAYHTYHKVQHSYHLLHWGLGLLGLAGLAGGYYVYLEPKFLICESILYAVEWALHFVFGGGS